MSGICWKYEDLQKAYAAARKMKILPLSTHRQYLHWPDGEHTAVVVGYDFLTQLPVSPAYAALESCTATADRTRKNFLLSSS